MIQALQGCKIILCNIKHWTCDEIKQHSIHKMPTTHDVSSSFTNAHVHTLGFVKPFVVICANVNPNYILWKYGFQFFLIFK
jgi:hypothetical protein